MTALIEAETPAPPADSPLPVVGGAIGYLGFELPREVEAQVAATTLNDVGAPDLAFAWYAAAVVEDHVQGRTWLVGRPDAVAALRAHLAAGDIYQVNLSQRFSKLCPSDGFKVYRLLRQVSAAPFSAYLDLRGELSGLEVFSSSPERFLLVDHAHLETRPIKGTRPRGAGARKDAALVEALLDSEKDRAEHVMIVDLERNDLGRVASTASVAVPGFAQLESYAQVHHLTSTVTAQRRPDVGLESLLRATLPGGSTTGAPKIFVLEIIDELEPTVRGVYTGAIGYISAHGSLDLNIAIRPITLVDGVAYLHVGGAIVHGSDPQAEYAETLDKARGMPRALEVSLPDEVDQVRVVPAPQVI